MAWPETARLKDGRIKGLARWPSNAELIADVAELHLDPAMSAVDLTYGMGVWWKRWRPDSLVCHDLDPEKGDGVSFLELPEDDCTYDLTAFDPNYVIPGGRETSTLAKDSDLWDRFGMDDETIKDPPGLIRKILGGLREAHRVTKPYREHPARLGGRPKQGLVMVKCQDFNWGGKYWPVTYEITKVAIDELGMRQYDRFDLENNGSRQSKGRTQRKAVRNSSAMLIFARRAPVASLQADLGL